MKTVKWTVVTLIAVALAGMMIGVSGCKEDESSRSQNPGGSKAVQYTCTMHPEIVQDKPGKCSKCGMDLVEKK